MANRNDILARINAWLTPENFQDYAPNGLQVEGVLRENYFGLSGYEDVTCFGIIECEWRSV